MCARSCEWSETQRGTAHRNALVRLASERSCRCLELLPEQTRRRVGGLQAQRDRLCSCAGRAARSRMDDGSEADRGEGVKGGRAAGQDEEGKAERRQTAAARAKRRAQARGQIDVCMIARVQAKERAEKGGWRAEESSDAGRQRRMRRAASWPWMRLRLRRGTWALRCVLRAACCDLHARQLQRPWAARPDSPPLRLQLRLLGSWGQLRQAARAAPAPRGHGVRRGLGKLQAC
jgi:hypothetical protein